MPKGELAEPTKAFFETEPRAQAIRDLCVEILAVTEYLMEFPQPNSDAYQAQMARVERLETRLMDLGIEMNMQMNRPARDYFTKPTVAAEYVAGQIYNFISRPIPNIAGVFVLGGEFGGTSIQASEEDSKEGMIVDLHAVPEARDFLTFRSGWNNFERMLDVSDAELKPHRDHLLSSS